MHLPQNAAVLGLASEVVSCLAAIASSGIPDAYRLSVSPADGTQTLTVNGRALHSRNAEREADAIARTLAHPKKNVFLFFGLGLAHHCLAFAREREALLGGRDHRLIHVIIIEPDPVIAAITLSQVDLSALAVFRPSLILADTADAVVTAVARMLPPERIKGIGAAVLNGLTKEHKEFAQLSHEAVMQWLEREYSNIITRFHFNSIWTRNIIANARHLMHGADIRGLHGGGAGLPAIIAAGGPTLNDAMDAICAHRTAFALIAVDTALAPLAKAGIVPDIVVTVDAGFYNYLDFIIDRTMIPCLVMELSAYPAIAHAAAERMFFFARSMDDGRPSPFIASLTGDAYRGEGEGRNRMTTLASSSTVASTAIDLAAYAGFSPCVLIGHDLSYPRYETHAKHANAYEYFLARTDRLSPMTSRAFMHLKGRVSMEDGVPTDFILSQQASWYASMKERYPSNRMYRVRSEARRVAGVDELAIDALRMHGVPGAMEKVRQVIRSARPVRYDGIEQRLSAFALLLDEVQVRMQAVLARIADDTAAAGTIERETRAYAEEMSSRIPFLADGIAYMMFSIDRREGDGARLRAHALASELCKLAVHFRTRIRNALSRMKA